MGCNSVPRAEISTWGRKAPAAEAAPSSPHRMSNLNNQPLAPSPAHSSSKVSEPHSGECWSQLSPCWSWLESQKWSRKAVSSLFAPFPKTCLKTEKPVIFFLIVLPLPAINYAFFLSVQSKFRGTKSTFQNRNSIIAFWQLSKINT